MEPLLLVSVDRLLSSVEALIESASTPCSFVSSREDDAFRAERDTMEFITPNLKSFGCVQESREIRNHFDTLSSGWFGSAPQGKPVPAHLVWQAEELKRTLQTARKAIAGNKSATGGAQTPPNGPKGSHFYWNGVAVKLAPLQLKLIKGLWRCRAHAAKVETVLDKVWGHSASDSALRKAASKASTCFAAKIVPVSVSVSNGMVILNLPE